MWTCRDGKECKDVADVAGVAGVASVAKRQPIINISSEKFYSQVIIFIHANIKQSRQKSEKNVKM